MNDVFVLPSAAEAVREDNMDRISALYDQGLYRQALDAGEAAWGPVRQWQGLSARLLASRILSQLGLFRSSCAMVFSCWRKESRTFDLCYAYVRTLYNLRGPYAGRKALLALQDGLQASANEMARWQGLSSIIHAAYRDWERAHACVDEAMRLSSDPDDYLFERAWLFEAQDRYDDALEALARVPAPTPNRERMLLQSRSRLLEITGQQEEMLAILMQSFDRFESVDIGMRLHHFLTEREQLDEADACLARVRALVPEGERSVSEDIAIARANSCYRRGDRAGTLEALAPVRGHYFRKVRESLAASHEACRKVLLDVPFIRQHHMTCVPATLAAIWRHHGHHIDHLSLAEEICYDGTSDLAERQWLEEQGWAVREFELNLQDVSTLIDAGCPVGFVTVEPGSAHMQAIIGYDTFKGIYLLRDPYYPAVQEILIDGAHEFYAASGPRCIVCVPPERRDWLMSLPLRHADLYDEYFLAQKALAAHQRLDALRLVEHLEAVAPGHRLALWARRSLARYDNDTLRQLHYTEALLELFPDDLNLMVSKSRLLGDLGKQSDRLAFLEACRAKGVQHPYLLQSLADQLAEDNRRAEETHALLDDILKRQPLSASAWWTLAGQHWERMERDIAFECYRLCVCLEDKVEGYATSYFKAARFLRRTDEALAYLQRRIDWLGSRSANPFITYARALDLLERGNESLSVLEEALAKHPDSEFLIAETFDLHMAAGHHEQAARLLDDRGSALSEALRLNKQARLAEHLSDHDAEMSAWRQLLALQPRNENAISQIARLLNEKGQTAEAIAFLDGHLAENPHNLWLLHEKLRYVRQLPLEQRRPHLDAMLSLHPEDLRITSAMARQERAEGRDEQALALMQRAVAIDPDEAWLHLELGDTFRDMGRLAEAGESYRTAITLYVDADSAFERLLSVYVGFDDKCKALSFIHGELMRQVSFGNGILEFQQLARRYLPDSQVKQFLQEAVTSRPDLWQSWVAAARFALETDSLDEAQPLLDEAVSRFPLLPRVWVERAEVRRLLDKVDGAESDLRMAISINPHYSTAITRLADVLELLGKQQEALDVLRRALQRSPGNAPYAGYCADLLWRMGHRDEAWQTLAAALALSPEYGWGWGQLLHWSRVLQRVAEAEAHAVSLAQRFPDSVELWRRCADFSSDPQQQRAYLQRALDLAPYRTDTLQDMCNLMVDDGHIAEARALLARTYPEAGSKPSEITTYEAWLTMRTGHVEEAIAAMEKVVVADPGHYNAWRLLALWHHQQGNGEDCCRCARLCVALHPQDAGVLVTAAEYLLAHADAAAVGSNAASVRAEIYEWLERAVTLDHTNIYNALTLADLYLDDGKLDECARLFSRGTLDNRDIYLQARFLRLDVLQGRVQPALARWREFLETATENEWLLLQPYHWFVAKGLQAEADDCLRAVASLPDPSWMAARAWVQGLMAGKPTGQQILDALQRIREKQAFWAEAVHYLLTRTEATDQQLSPLFWHAAADVEADAKTWSALVNYRMSREAWAHLARLGRHASSLPDAPARSVYFCSIGWRFTRHWTTAVELADLARQRARDDSHDNLRLWQQLDAWLADPATVDVDVLQELDLRELTKVERVLLILLERLVQLPTGITVTEVEALQQAWRSAQKDFAEASTNAIVRQACGRIRFSFMRRLEGNTLAKLWTLARLLFSLRQG